MKRNKGLTIALIVLLTVIALLLAGILGYLLVVRSAPISIGSISSSEIFCDESYGAEMIDSIAIDSSCGDIEIKNSTDNTVRVTARGRYKNDFTINNENGNLSVEYKAENKFDLKSPGCDITVYLPNSFDKPIKLNLNYGDVEAYEVSNISISNDYGDVDINRISGGFDIISNYGDVEIGTADISENSSIEVDLGNISIERTNDIRIDSSVSMGENKINGSNSSSDIVLTVSADLGDIEIN